MEYYVNSKSEEATIYEIYKACRLCGAGAGYKMPIIQNVLNLANDEVELKLKVRECVQIEVHQDDKMPPLICELCVDKVNDFYEFLEMCRQTNMKTRLRLGLPPQKLSRGAPDAGDCILGITEPVFINNDSNENIKKNKTSKNIKIKKESESKLKTDTQLYSRLRGESKKHGETKCLSYKPEPKTSLRSGRTKQTSPPPSPLRLRGTKRSSEDDISLNKLLKPRRTEMNQPKSILKRATVEEPLPQQRNTRLREKEPMRQTNKKVKISAYAPIKQSKLESKPTRLVKPVSSTSNRCDICKINFQNIQALRSHMRSHANPKSSFAAKPLPKQESKSKVCTRCNKSFAYTSLMKIHKCSPKRVFTCAKCKRTFGNGGAMARHQISCGMSPVSTCAKCKRTFGNGGALARHQVSCGMSPDISEVKIPLRIRSKLRPLQVRLARCDSLLDERDSCDANAVSHDFGLDTNCEYPYLLSRSLHKRIKSELSIYDSMVNIQDEIRDEFDLDRRYVYWDSESEPESDVEMVDHIRNVESLSILALRNIFSPKLLGKVPRKLRKIKSEKPFESILNASEIDTDIRLGISNIIDSLNDLTVDKTDGNVDDDSLFDDNKGPGVKNSDFDAIFGVRNNSDKVNHLNIYKGDGDKKELDVSEDDIVSSNLDLSRDLSEKNNISESYGKNSIKDSQQHSTLDIIDVSKINNDASNNTDTSAVDISDTVICSDNLVSNNIIRDVLVNISETNIKYHEKETIANEICNEQETDKEECTNENRFEENNIEDEKYFEKETVIEDTFINNGINDTRSVESLEFNMTEDASDKSKSGSEHTNMEKLNSDEKNDKSKSLETGIEISDGTNEKIVDSNTNDALSLSNEKCDQGKNLNKIDATSEIEKVEIKVKCSDGAEKVNGNPAYPVNFNIDDLEDVSDTDMDDKKLMEALDAQIGDDEEKPVDKTVGADTRKEDV